MGCHDYFHARESLQAELKRLSGSEKTLVHARLKKLDELNTPELIRKYGYRRHADKRRGPRLWTRELEYLDVKPVPSELIELQHWDGYGWVPGKPEHISKDNRRKMETVLTTL
jgi:hypothetical protein